MIPRRLQLLSMTCLVVLAIVSCRRSAPSAATEDVNQSAKAPAYATLPTGAAGAVKSYQGHGQVLGVDNVRGRVTIAHQAIPGFMDAMTMTFRVKDGKLLREVKPGDEVDFTLEVTAQSVVISSIKRSADGGR